MHLVEGVVYWARVKGMPGAGLVVVQPVPVSHYPVVQMIGEGGYFPAEDFEILERIEEPALSRFGE